MVIYRDIATRFATSSFFHESVSPKPYRNSTVCIRATGVVDTGGKFSTAVFDNGGAPLLSNSSAVFRKNLK